MLKQKTIWILECDQCQAHLAAGGATKYTDVRAIALENGWTLKDGDWRCPVCAGVPEPEPLPF